MKLQIVLHFTFDRFLKMLADVFVFCSYQGQFVKYFFITLNFSYFNFF